MMNRCVFAALILPFMVAPALAADDHEQKMAEIDRKQKECEQLGTEDKKRACFKELLAEVDAEIAKTEAEMRRLGHEPKAPSCTIEDWRYSQYADGRHIKIDGRTSCRSGRLTLTLYDGDGEYIGSDFAFIRGHVFDTFVEGQAPKKVRLKYDIEPR